MSIVADFHWLCGISLSRRTSSVLRRLAGRKYYFEKGGRLQVVGLVAPLPKFANHLSQRVVPITKLFSNVFLSSTRTAPNPSHRKLLCRRGLCKSQPVRGSERVELMSGEVLRRTTAGINWVTALVFGFPVWRLSQECSSVIPILRSITALTSVLSENVTTGHFLRDVSCGSFRFGR